MQPRGDGPHDDERARVDLAGQQGQVEVGVAPGQDVRRQRVLHQHVPLLQGVGRKVTTNQSIPVPFQLHAEVWSFLCKLQLENILSV